MTAHVLLLLFCVLFPRAWALNCHDCIPGTTLCQAKECPYQCLSATISVASSAEKLNSDMQGCSTPDSCSSGSLNVGFLKVTNNAKCCKTPLCNSAKLPVLPDQVPNGRRCYTCDGDGCKNIINCEGDEDHCISSLGQSAVPMKGCVSKSFCDALTGTSVPGVDIKNVNCCEGNLCNGVTEIFTLSFLLTLVPLLSSILFY